MTANEIRSLQRGLNFFTTKYVKGFSPVLVDGKSGAATERRVKWVKFFLGYAGSVNSQNAIANTEFRSRMWHPNSVRYSTPARIARGLQRRRQQRANWRRNRGSGRKTSGVGTFDGKPVANVLIPYLRWARTNGWRGTLTSGWRDPRYSRALCQRICGRDSCPGRCAGTASNHVGTTLTRFAGDVTDYVRFGQLMRRCPIKPRIFNALGADDPVHFSPNGR